MRVTCATCGERVETAPWEDWYDLPEHGECPAVGDDKTYFHCSDCDVCVSGWENYMVHSELWESVAPARNFLLCVGCLEARLGRELRKADFTDAPVNDPELFPLKSSRLLDRLSRE